MKQTINPPISQFLEVVESCFQLDQVIRLPKVAIHIEGKIRIDRSELSASIGKIILDLHFEDPEWTRLSCVDYAVDKLRINGTLDFPLPRIEDLWCEEILNRIEEAAKTKIAQREAKRTQGQSSTENNDACN